MKNLPMAGFSVYLFPHISIQRTSLCLSTTPWKCIWEVEAKCHIFWALTSSSFSCLFIPGGGGSTAGGEAGRGDSRQVSTQWCWRKQFCPCQELNSGCPACSQLLSSFITVQINKQTNKQTSKQITGIKELTP
jgi:hypothetical protein